MTVALPMCDDPALRDRRHTEARAARDVADWLSWLDLGGHAHRTLDQYERDLATLLNAYPDKALADFTDGDLAYVLKRWKNQSTRRVRKASFASFFSWAMKTRRISDNPVTYLPDIKPAPRKIANVFTEAEVSALCSLPSPNGHLLRILFDTGLRKAEASNLRARDCNLDSGELLVINGKGGKDRIVPMTWRLRASIAELVTLEGINQSDYIWHTRPGGGTVISRRKPIGEGSFARWWAACIEEAGVRYRNPHTTRHTFATTCLRHGVRLDRLSMAMGHASIKTTFDEYGHLTTADVAEDILLLEVEQK